MIDDLARRAFVLFSGLPVDSVPPTLPFAKGPAPALFVYRDKLRKRMQHWIIEGHRRLASRREMQPNEAAIEGKSHRKTAEPRPDLLPNNLEVSVNRIKSAQILGITTRTLDRWVADGRLTPLALVRVSVSKPKT